VVAGGVIDLTGLDAYAFSVPRDGTITSISAYLSTAAELSLADSAVTVTAQLYSSSAPDDTFTPVAGASVTLQPPLTGTVPTGTAVSGIAEGLALPIAAETRLLMVFSPTVTAGPDTAAVITGNLSAGISIT
jgi:BclB C-terminal domain-containing protein